VVPAVFVLSAGAMTVLSIANEPSKTLPWLGVLVVGLPAYVLWTRLGGGRSSEVA
jgi:hypothetical protein